MNTEKIQAELENFARDRDWNQFHSPKNLVMALSVEVAELVEQFQWMGQEESANLSESSLAAVREEMADVQIYLLRLADKLRIDIESAVEKKIEENGKKYPVKLVKDSPAKYTQYK